jgi:hypothetical protein
MMNVDCFREKWKRKETPEATTKNAKPKKRITPFEI